MRQLMKMKNGILFVLMIVAGVVVGSLLGEATRSVSALSWLSFSKTIGISADHPAVLDISVLKLAFGLELKISVAQVICIIGGIVAYEKIR